MVASRAPRARCPGGWPRRSRSAFATSAGGCSKGRLAGDARRFGRAFGYHPAVYTDIDAALALARQYDLYYTLVLFNFPGDIPQSWVNDPAQRQKLADVLAPLFARYANEPRIFSWEVFNEPEWDMWNGKVNTANTQATVRAIVNSVQPTKYVTVGSAMLDGLTFLDGHGLDYYKAHWYDYMHTGDWNATAATTPP
jgi:hypothetical protein